MKTLADIVDETIADRLAEFSGDKVRAAKSLGISVRTIYSYIHRWAALKPEMLYRSNGVPTG